MLIVGIAADLALAARRLRATPLFAIFAALSLALGIGVTTAVHSIVDSIFLAGFGISEPDRTAFVVMPYDGRMLKGSISEPDFEDLKAVQRSFTSLSASAFFHPAVASASTTELLAAEAVDGRYFSTLGVPATLGRTIQPSDDATAARVAVLSHGLWRARFAADPAIVGQTIRVSGHTFEVIGVAASRFEGVNGPVGNTRLWIPLAAEASLLPAIPASRPPRERRRLTVFGRLSPTVDVAAASAELAAIASSLDAAFPPRLNGRAVATERPWKANRSQRLRRKTPSFVVSG